MSSTSSTSSPACGSRRASTAPRPASSGARSTWASTSMSALSLHSRTASASTWPPATSSSASRSTPPTASNPASTTSRSARRPSSTTSSVRSTRTPTPSAPPGSAAARRPRPSEHPACSRACSRTSWRTSALSGRRAYGDQKLVIAVAVGQLALAQFLSRVCVKEGGSAQHIAVRCDVDLLEHFSKEPFGALTGEAPPIAPVALVFPADLTHAWHGREDDPVRFHEVRHTANRGMHVIDERQGLRADEAVVCGVRQSLARCEVTDDGRLIVACVVKHVRPGYLIVAVPLRIRAFGDFEHSTAYIAAMLGEEAFDVPPVDRLAPIEPELAAHRFQAGEPVGTGLLAGPHSHGGYSSGTAAVRPVVPDEWVSSLGRGPSWSDLRRTGRRLRSGSVRGTG